MSDTTGNPGAVTDLPPTASPDLSQAGIATPGLDFPPEAPISTSPTQVAPAVPAVAGLEIDYDKLAAAIVTRQTEVRVTEVTTGSADEPGPYPHVFVDGVFQAHLSGENHTDPLTRELSGLAPLPA